MSMEVILAFNSALKPTGNSCSFPSRSGWNGQDNLQFEWSLECVPHVLLKDTNYVSENIVVDIGQIRG